jgi:hypothetical protein
MFSLFKNPVGISISGDEWTVVRAQKNTVKPSIDILIRKKVEAGSELAFLSKLKKEHKLKYCNVGIPGNEVFNAVLNFPAEMKGENLDFAVRKKLSEVLPFPAHELTFQYTAFYGVKPGKVVVLLAALEHKMYLGMQRIFEQAGLKAAFMVEGLGVASAFQINLEKYPKLMLLHVYNDKKAIMASFLNGRVFESLESSHFKDDFQGFHHSYQKQIGSALENVHASGEIEFVQSLRNIDFGEAAPQFITSNFAVQFQGKEISTHDLIVATGFSLIGPAYAKKTSLLLFNLLG